MVTSVLHAHLYVNTTDPGSAGWCWTDTAAKIPSNVGRQKNNTTEQKLHTSGATRRRFPPYLVGRLTTMKTQRNSFTGREGFAIAAEAKFDGTIITIFPSSSVPMDASVYSLGSPSPRCITHASGSGSANLDPTQTSGGAG